MDTSEFLVSSRNISARVDHPQRNAARSSHGSCPRLANELLTIGAEGIQPMTPEGLRDLQGPTDRSWPDGSVVGHGMPT